MATDTRYIYFRPNTKTNASPAISIGYYTDDNNNLVASIAFCSPKDRFCKKTARTIINGRIEAGKCVVIETEYDREPKYHDAMHKILDHLIKKNWKWQSVFPIPSWFYKMEFFKTQTD